MQLRVILDSLNNKSSFTLAHKGQRGREQKRDKNINPLMTQQEQMLTAAQNELSHAPLIRLLFDLSDLLPTGVFLFVLQKGNGDHWHGICCCPSQQIQTYYWH